MFNRFTFSVLLLLTSRIIFAQSCYPVNYFRCPVDSTLNLAGNFGEIRPNHYHAGFDIKTNNHEGMPVYAAADGFVSRIKISPTGYGNALYIDHPNGYTTVYGHLQSYNHTIGSFAKQIQSSKELFEIDTLLPANLFPVKKGDLIALSGNTGGSQGPHLHFEIRDTKTESPINPYCFGYTVKDKVKPVITKVAIYPLGENATVNGKHITKKIKPICGNGKYFCNNSDTISVNGDIGFGVECYDSESGSSNKNGVYSIELQSGGKRIYYHELERFTFENGRFVNAHIDFSEKQKHDYKIQKCYLSKNDQTGIYKGVFNWGIIDFVDDSVHWIRYIIKDYAGNSTEMMLKVRSKSKSKINENVVGSNVLILDCFKENQFKKEDIEINIPAYALYDDLKFNYYKSPKSKGLYSMVHHIQDSETAIQKLCTLSLKADNLPISLQSKAVIVSIKDKGYYSYEGGSYLNGWVQTQFKTFGNFAITVDTTAPYIRPVFKAGDRSNVDLRKARIIGIKVSDNLSGIKKYHATIDDKWVLFEYDAKKSFIYYTFDSAIKPGKHSFYIEVTDDKSNVASWKCSFVR